MRVLVTGWSSFLDGEATAGDVLSMEAVRDALLEAGLGVDVAWSPRLRADGLSLEHADPNTYTHLLFVCGPAHGRQVRQLHERFAHCRRLAVGVSVVMADDPAVTGFHQVIARDGDGVRPHRDLAAAPRCGQVPVVGVVLAHAQHEYGNRQCHGDVHAMLTSWLGRQNCARLPFDTRLDSHDWRLAGTSDQLESVIRRLDVMVTTRMHGLVLALKNGIPALAIDPIAGGAKVTAQAATWAWPAVVAADALTEAQLNYWWDWCRSADCGVLAARCRHESTKGTLVPRLLQAITGH
ncbi:MAG TPA: polysaccharide pyruvyl transferase family protein [Pseudonocardiaceae bacterium]|nr:polysaccharide pyruvyl transferase family protein [Pseudonocardiaceae bacterium]